MTGGCALPYKARSFVKKLDGYHLVKTFDITPFLRFDFEITFLFSCDTLNSDSIDGL